MAAPQRLNVLISRARNVLIMIGNANTFISSRKNKDCWVPFINRLMANGHLYDGLPVKCEQHPHKTAILKTKEDFDTECPDGGCPAPWYGMFFFFFFLSRSFSSHPLFVHSFSRSNSSSILLSIILFSFGLLSCPPLPFNPSNSSS